MKTLNNRKNSKNHYLPSEKRLVLYYVFRPKMLCVFCVPKELVSLNSLNKQFNFKIRKCYWTSYAWIHTYIIYKIKVRWKGSLIPYPPSWWFRKQWRHYITVVNFRTSCVTTVDSSEWNRLNGAFIFLKVYITFQCRRTQSITKLPVSWGHELE